VTELLTSATAKDERDRDAKVALLPIGSFEQHGDYLPLTTDTVVACAIANKIAEAYPVFVLPPVTLSCSHEHAAWQGTVSISSQTLYRIINDVADSLSRSGVEHLVLINGHGGNYILSNVVQEYTTSHGPAMSLFPQGHDWAKARVDAGIETDGQTDMHAGELETSILLATAAHLLRPGYENSDSIADDRPALLTYGMAEYTKSGVIGRPSLGSEEKGSKALRSLQDSFGLTPSQRTRKTGIGFTYNPEDGQ
jgi:creatinine amidohydrolase